MNHDRKTFRQMLWAMALGVAMCLFGAGLNYLEKLP